MVSHCDGSKYGSIGRAACYESTLFLSTRIPLQMGPNKREQAPTSTKQTDSRGCETNRGDAHVTTSQLAAYCFHLHHHLAQPQCAANLPPCARTPGREVKREEKRGEGAERKEERTGPTTQ
jgi:hypothetical protein